MEVIALNRNFPAQGYGRPIGLSGALALFNYYSSISKTHPYIRGTHYMSSHGIASGQAPVDAPKPDTPIHTAHAEPRTTAATPPAGGAETAAQAMHGLVQPEAEPRAETVAEARAAAQSETEACDEPRAPALSRRLKPRASGLLRYKKWWMRRQADFSVGGKLISGMPVFLRSDTLRVINATHSYYIPLQKIDFIRTDDGLESSFEHSGQK